MAAWRLTLAATVASGIIVELEARLVDGTNTLYARLVVRQSACSLSVQPSSGSPRGHTKAPTYLLRRFSSPPPLTSVRRPRDKNSPIRLPPALY